MSVKKIPTAHKGRRCKYEGCRQTLSIYNHELHCHVHRNILSGKTRWEDWDADVKKGVRP